MQKEGKAIRNKKAHICKYVSVITHVHTKQKTISVYPAANKTADHKELQLCRDRHENFGGVGHWGEVHTDFVML